MGKCFFREIEIGGRIVPGNLALAPMAGTSDLAFRTICHEEGASLGCTELVSARGIRYEPSMRRCFRFLRIEPEREGPVAIQLFGFEAADFEAAIPTILENVALRGVLAIDLNMGCPVAKVVNTGAGAALMREPKRAEVILRAAVRAAEPFGVPVSVKFRKGWDEGSTNAADFARMCVDAGAASIAVHARSRAQMYGGRADWSILAEVVRATEGSKVPIWGNGDVTDGASAIRMLEETGVDGIMVGRAAQGNPWIFGEIRAAMRGEIPPEGPSPEVRAAVIRRHLDGLCELLGEEIAVREMRAQLAAYFRGVKNGTAFKSLAMNARSREEVSRLLDEWIATL